MIDSIDVVKQGNDLIFVVKKERMYVFDARMSFDYIKPHLSQFFDNVIFDLEKLKNFDSSFVALLINTANTLNIYKKKAILRNACTSLKRTFEIYGIASFFDIE